MTLGESIRYLERRDRQYGENELRRLLPLNLPGRSSSASQKYVCKSKQDVIDLSKKAMHPDYGFFTMARELEDYFEPKPIDVSGIEWTEFEQIFAKCNLYLKHLEEEEIQAGLGYLVSIIVSAGLVLLWKIYKFREKVQAINRIYGFDDNTSFEACVARFYIQGYRRTGGRGARRFTLTRDSELGETVMFDPPL